MPVCKKCGYQNREDNEYCVNCGSVLELTEEHMKAETAKKTTATKNYIAYFLIIMGFCTLFGGLMTYVTSMGTIVQDITAQVTAPYIIIGLLFMLIGLIIYSIKTEEYHEHEPTEDVLEQRELTEFMKEGKAKKSISCGTCAFFGKPVLCQLGEKNPNAIACVYYQKKS